VGARDQESEDGVSEDQQQKTPNLRAWEVLKDPANPLLLRTPGGLLPIGVYNNWKQNSDLAEFIGSACRARESALSGAHGKWIPVAERRPVTAELVLVCAPAWLGQQVYIGWSNEFGWNLDCEDPNAEAICAKITHWMPLPEPPKESGASTSARAMADDSAKPKGKKK
jgi:uncharacterized protein DUF551